MIQGKEVLDVLRTLKGISHLVLSFSLLPRHSLQAYTHTHTHTPLVLSPKLLYPEPSCSAGVGPFLSLLSTPLTSERTGSAPLQGLACSRTLDVDIFGAAGPPHPGNQAPLSTYPSLFAQPLFPPRPTLLLFPLAVGLEESLRDSMLFCACCLVVLLVAGFLWCTKAPIHFRSLSFYGLPQGRNPCLITLGEKERPVVLLTFPLAFDSLMCCWSVCPAAASGLFRISPFFFYVFRPAIVKPFD